MTTSSNRAAGGPATYRGLFASGEYVGLLAAQVLSLSGDQLARVAVAVLVFQRTGSAAATALVYAVTYLPWLVSGPVLGGLADRYPRRRILLVCQVASAVVVATMALPQTSLVILTALLFVTVTLEAPFTSARAALLLDVLPDDRYVLANGIGQVTIQATQVLGFAVGGAVVYQIGARPALLVDAVTFAAAAVLVAVFVRRRPAQSSKQPSLGHAQRLRVGIRTVFGDRRLRRLVLLAWLAAFWVLPEALAAPLGGGDPRTVGLILAGQPIGAVVGGVLLTRFVSPPRRMQLIGPLAVLSGVPLLGLALSPSLSVTVVLLAASGAATSYTLPANAAFMQTVPAAHRGQSFALAVSGLVAGQGLSIACAGVVSDLIGSAGITIALGATVGVAGAVLLLRASTGDPQT